MFERYERSLIAFYLSRQFIDFIFVFIVNFYFKSSLSNFFLLFSVSLITMIYFFKTFGFLYVIYH